MIGAVRGQTAWFGLMPREFIFLMFIAVFVTLLLLPFWMGQTFWVVVGLVFFMFQAGHLCYTASRTVALPGLIAFILSIQCFFASWLAYFFPPSFSLFDMRVPMNDYFSYAVPAVIAFWGGVHLPLKMERPDVVREKPEPAPLSGTERFVMDLLIIFGILLIHFPSLLPGSLSFLVYIIAQIRFVGALTFLFTKSKGWAFRVALVYLDFIIFVSAGGIFYEFVVWAVFLFLALAYVRKWKAKFLIYFLIAFLAMFFLNTVKRDFREKLAVNNASALAGMQAAGGLMGASHSMADVYYQDQKPRGLGDYVSRFNQGWIVAQIISAVPSIEPYAKGRTIVESIASSVTARIFNPEKREASSQSFFSQYTGLPLSKNTSMQLGVIGEMYANFGRVGGAIGMCMYGLFLGFIFSQFARRAERHLMWWAWAPFVLVMAVEAEWNLADILNCMIKSFVVMLGLIYTIPFFNQRLLRKKKMVLPDVEASRLVS